MPEAISSGRREALAPSGDRQRIGYRNLRYESSDMRLFNSSPMAIYRTFGIRQAVWTTDQPKRIGSNIPKPMGSIDLNGGTTIDNLPWDSRNA
jgi:hypothetical protein